MKRSPLKRYSPLRARRRKPLDAADRQAATGFHAVVTSGRCIVCGRSKAECWRDGTKLEAHHVVEAKMLRKLGRTDLLYDPRVGAALCGDPCHRQHTNRSHPVPRERLPKASLDVAASLGLDWYIERYYPAS